MAKPQILSFKEEQQETGCCFRSCGGSPSVQRSKVNSKELKSKLQEI